MKASLILVAAVLTFSAAYSQEFQQTLEPFNKVVVSHKIDLVLIPGDTESIRIEYSGVDKEKIIIDQSGHRLHVYLENAKFFDIGERRRESWDRRERYRHAQVTAYVTFKELKLIETRGEGNVLCEGNIVSKKLKVRAYGDTDVRFAYIEAGKVKARLYGDNTMRIRDGETGHISYKLFGDNRVDSRGLTSVTASTTVYGDGQVALHSSEELHVTSFGDPQLYVIGSPHISKGLILGNANIRRN